MLIGNDWTLTFLYPALRREPHGRSWSRARLLAMPCLPLQAGAWEAGGKQKDACLPFLFPYLQALIQDFTLARLDWEDRRAGRIGEEHSVLTQGPEKGHSFPG